MSATQRAPWDGKNGESASQRAAKIIGGVAVAAGKSRTAQSQNLLDVGRRHALCQQRARHPQIHDALVGRCEALQNVPALHPAPLDRGGLRAGRAGSSHWRQRCRNGWRSGTCSWQ